MRKYKALVCQKIWVLTDLPPHRKVIGCKWVYRIKHHDGSIARSVAKGYCQEEGIHYDKTFSPFM